MTERAENLLGVLALLIVDDMQTAGDDATDTPGLTGRAILNAIGMYPGCTIEQLRAVVDLSHSATVRAVASLVDGALVRKLPNADKRAVSLMLTPAGRRAADRMHAHRNGVLERVTHHLSERERAQFESLLLKMLWHETRDAGHAARVCRLCDDASCLAAGCPVECRLEGLPIP